MEKFSIIIKPYIGVDGMKKVTEINLKVGDAIRKGLQRKGMTQKELAMLVGSTQRSISSYINGNAQPPLDILSLICRILEINMNQILQIPDYNFQGVCCMIRWSWRL